MCSNVTDISQRKRLLRKIKRCLICPRKNHIAKDCKSNRKCNKCQMRHNIFICTKGTKTLYVKGTRNNIMLQSAVACVSKVEDYKTSILSRVLFNNCSQRTYITTSLKKKLKLRTIRKENRPFGNLSVSISASASLLAATSASHSNMNIVFLKKHKPLELKVASIYLLSKHSTACNLYSCNVS